MKRSHEQFLRWLEQAEHQLEVTEALFERGFWSDVCFMAEQTAQMALRHSCTGPVSAMYLSTPFMNRSSSAQR